MLVSKKLTTLGTHTLRVVVHYGNAAVLRKFYRFNVDQPVEIKSTVGRIDDESCAVVVQVTNLTEEGMTINQVYFESKAGVVGKRVVHKSSRAGAPSSAAPSSASPSCAFPVLPSTATLFDASNRLDPHSTIRFMYTVTCNTPASKTQGLAAGDVLGLVSLEWKKCMGEEGSIASSDIRVPPATQVSDERSSC